MNQSHDIVQGVILDENLTLALKDLTDLCGISDELLALLVGEGLLAPRGESPADWRFDGLQVRRIRRALRLSHDLELDWPATALTLDLLDEIDRLRERLQGLELQLARWD